MFHYYFDITYYLSHLEIHSNSVEKISGYPHPTSEEGQSCTQFLAHTKSCRHSALCVGTQPGSPSVQHSYEYTH